MANEKLAGSLKDAPIEYLNLAKPIANARRLALPHARVKVSHTGPKLNPPVLNPMLVMDRHEQYQSLQPGQSIVIEMVLDEIERFKELRKPGRWITRQTQIGELYIPKLVEAPLHPLLIEEV